MRTETVKLKRAKGFTLVELLVSLVVSAIILSAAAALAGVFSSANEATKNMSEKQSQLRGSTIWLKELIKNSKLICRYEENNLAIWRADDNGDGQLNLNELIYIGSDGDRDYVRVFEFYDDNRVIQLYEIEPMVSGWENYGCWTYNSTMLVTKCENLQFALDADPPWTRLVGISFDMEENGVVSNYRVNVALRAWAGNLLDEAGTVIVSDDD